MRLMRAYARGRMHEAARRHPRIMDMDEDRITQIVENGIGVLLRQDIVRVRYRLIEGAMYTSLRLASTDEYAKMWIDPEVAMLELPSFQPLRDEIQDTVNNAFRVARQMLRVPPATPVKVSKASMHITPPPKRARHM